MRLGLIAAVADNGIIGKGNSLPWKIREDLAHFKKITMGHSVIMGSRTYSSILDALGKPFPGRYNIVLNETPVETREGVVTASNFDEAVEIARSRGSTEAWVAGGRMVYGEALKRSDLEFMEITKVHRQAEGDVYFPEVDWSKWVQVSSQAFPEYSFVSYRRAV